MPQSVETDGKRVFPLFMKFGGPPKGGGPDPPGSAPGFSILVFSELSTIITNMTHETFRQISWQLGKTSN